MEALKMEDKKQDNFFKKFATFFKRKKQPVNSMKEAEELAKECKTYLIISIIGAVVLGFLMGISRYVQYIVTPLAMGFMAGVVVFGINYYGMNLVMKKMKNLTCNKCGNTFKFEDCVEWHEVSRNVTNTRSGNTIRLVLRITVDITCKCPKCGETKSFRVTLSPGGGTATRYSANINLTPAEEIIKDYFNGIIHA